MAFTERHIRETRREKRKGSNRALILWILGIICLMVYFLYSSIASVGSTLVPIGTYTLDKWATVNTLPASLKLKIPDWKYKLWVKYFAPKIENLQAGGYKVDSTLELDEVFRTILVKPVFTDLTITILPGWNSYDIDDYLYRKDIIENPGDFLMALRDGFGKYQSEYTFLHWVTSMEGFLYPDTYRIPKTANADTVARKLLDEWQKRIWPTYTQSWSISSKLTPYQELILASIVEREEWSLSEQTVVAGILMKRVLERIPMGADATVCFGYAKTQKQCTPSFIGSVIAEKHPYNTRNKQGFPPTPIASISEWTWNAVLHTESSPYYYYLHDLNGAIHYAKTLAEHNANKAKYIQ